MVTTISVQSYNNSFHKYFKYFQYNLTITKMVKIQCRASILLLYDMKYTAEKNGSMFTWNVVAYYATTFHLNILPFFSAVYFMSLSNKIEALHCILTIFVIVKLCWKYL